MSAYLSPSTRRPLLGVIEDCLLRPHAGTLLARGFGPLVEGNRAADLRRLLVLFSRLGPQASKGEGRWCLGKRKETPRGARRCARAVAPLGVGVFFDEEGEKTRESESYAAPKK